MDGPGDAHDARLCPGTGPAGAGQLMLMNLVVAGNLHNGRPS